MRKKMKQGGMGSKRIGIGQRIGGINFFHVQLKIKQICCTTYLMWFLTFNPTALLLKGFI